MAKPGSMKKAISLGLTLSMLSIPGAFAQMQVAPYSQTIQMAPYSQSGSPPSQMSPYTQSDITYQHRSVTIPAGTSLTIRETGFAGKQGDAFSGQLVNPVSVNGVEIIPTGSTVQGQVSTIDNQTNMRHIQLSSVATPGGDAVPFSSSIAASMAVGVAAVKEEPLAGQVSKTAGGVSSYYPQVSVGRATTPAGKIIGSTLAGAALGGATGTLTGLTIGATSKDSDIALSQGSMASRGLAWGAAYGAAFGLLGGLIAAATTPKPVAVTATSTTTTIQPTEQILNVTLEQPVTIAVAEPVPAPPPPVVIPPPVQESPVRGYW